MNPFPQKLKLKSWHADAGGLIVCLGLSALAWFLAVEPMLRHCGELAAQQRSMDEQSLHSTQLHAQLRLTARQLSQLTLELESNPVELQPANRLNQRIAQITREAGECGLVIGNVQPLSLVQTPRHAIVPIELSGSGSFKSCLEFLQRFHQRFGDSGVAAFELGAGPTEGGQIWFSFRLHWYVEPQSAAVAAQ